MRLGYWKNWLLTAIMMLVVGEAATGEPGAFFDVSKAGQWSIKGTVMRLAPDGIFVKCAVNSDTSSRKPGTDEIVFIQDPFPGQGVFKG